MKNEVIEEMLDVTNRNMSREVRIWSESTPSLYNGFGSCSLYCLSNPVASILAMRSSKKMPVSFGVEILLVDMCSSMRG